MISAGEFRNGITVEFEGGLYTVIDFQHVKPGKGAAFVRSTLKNMENGAILEKTFRPTEKMPRAHIDRRDLQYLYSDGQMYHFMDVESYEQSEMNAAQIGDNLQFVKENDMIKVLVHNGRVFGIEPPMFAELAVTDTEPGFRGDTATGATKPATVETGTVVKVPLFVNTGDVIKIDTRTGEYLGRI
jgi:elongation factor P